MQNTSLSLYQSNELKENMKMEKKTIFDDLNSVNVSGHTENKNGLTYLSWAWAYAEVMKKYPDMTYEIDWYDGKPYLYDENTGYLVTTSVTIQGNKKTMWLPVMDGANKAMKKEPYTYTVRRYGKTETKTVEAATMFDVNKTIMRCLVKNFAMFGLGLYIYAGEDLPEEDTKQQVSNNIEQETLEYANLRTEMDSLGIDFRSEKFNVCLEKSTKLKHQDIQRMNVDELHTLNKFYKQMIVEFNKKKGTSERE